MNVNGNQAPKCLRRKASEWGFGDNDSELVTKCGGVRLVQNNGLRMDCGSREFKGRPQLPAEYGEGAYTGEALLCRKSGRAIFPIQTQTHFHIPQQLSSCFALLCALGPRWRGVPSPRDLNPLCNCTGFALVQQAQKAKKNRHRDSKKMRTGKKNGNIQLT